MCNNLTSQPLAASGYISYRYRGEYGYVMIGAKDSADALRESLRSTRSGGDIARLEIWNSTHYVPATNGGQHA